MKELKEIIQEKLKVGSKTKINQYEYQPKDKSEFTKLLNKLIKERGWEGDFNDIDTSKITDMSYLFTFGRLKFNGDISKWDVSNVEDMQFMFYESNFAGDISKWDVSNVKNMRHMFKNSPLEKNPPKWYHE